jgi:lambda family phage minor tail protein L
MAITNKTRDELGLDARYDIGRSLLDKEPSAIIELYELYYNITEEPFRFHAGTNNLTKDIVWNGNEYYASAIEVEGFEANILGRLPRPKVTVSNINYVISSILRDYSDFRNGKFVRVKLFLKHLDAINFDGGENPFGTPDPLAYISKEKYLISQKIVENKQLVQFELITPFDLQSLETATRAIYGRYCYWQYRGMGCNYQGDLICKENDENFSISPNRNNGNFIKNQSGAFKNLTFQKSIESFKWQSEKIYEPGDIVFVENIDFNGFKDPPRTFFVCKQYHTSSKFIIPNKSLDFWEKDGCSKTINACKKRFRNPFYVGNNYTAYNDSDTVNGVMPFGGFPGTDRFKYEQ